MENYLSLQEVISKTGLSARTISRLRNEKLFPEPSRILPGPGRPKQWAASVITAWIDERLAASRRPLVESAQKLLEQALKQ
jgi:predicted DNA-binding transcriptional regulator AlpA